MSFCDCLIAGFVIWTYFSVPVIYSLNALIPLLKKNLPVAIEF